MGNIIKRLKIFTGGSSNLSGSSLPSQTGNDNKVLSTDGSNTVWTSELKDAAGTTSIDFETRILKDNLDNLIIDYQNSTLNQGAQVMINWANGFIYNGATNETVIRWGSQELRDDAGVDSLYWTTRQLLDDTGSPQLQWDLTTGILINTSIDSPVYKVGGVTGDDATVVIPTVGTLTFVKGILTSFV